MATLKNVTISDTGFAQLASGTTAQRPASPAIGMVRFNTDTRVVETYTAAGWVAFDDRQTATGGTVTTGSGYTVHTFTSGGTFTPTYTGPVDVLVIAGGGGGAPGIGGGGGAGGLIYNQGVIVAGGTGYPVTIGPGGSAGPTGHGPDGNAGSPSVALGITATGGGAGAGYYSPNGNPPQIGGSGGGGPGFGYAGGIRPGPPGIAGQGHSGGYGVHWPGTPAGTHYAGGGGGGAGEPGYNRAGNWPTRGADNPQAWDVSLAGVASGGNGMSVAISGTATYYAGGGGGGNHGPGNSYGWATTYGGLGGGGYCTGGNGNPASGHGSGGGGAHHPGNEQGGAGSAGIVIVRYKSS